MDFDLMDAMGVSREITEKEPKMDGNTNEMRRKQTASALSDMPWQDGMKTHEPIQGYDPIANPTNDPLTNKQGVGGAGYDWTK